MCCFNSACVVFHCQDFFVFFQIPEQFRFMSQHPVKKKHRHKKHKSQDTERNKDSEAVGQGLRQPEPEKPASSSAGTLPKNGQANIWEGGS